MKFGISIMQLGFYPNLIYLYFLISNNNMVGAQTSEVGATLAPCSVDSLNGAW
jgi:hypothetical protein